MLHQHVKHRLHKAGVSSPTSQTEEAERESADKEKKRQAKAKKNEKSKSDKDKVAAEKLAKDTAEQEAKALKDTERLLREEEER